MIYFDFRFPDIIYKFFDNSTHSTHGMWIAIGKYKYTTGDGFHKLKFKNSEEFIRMKKKLIPYRLIY